MHIRVAFLILASLSVAFAASISSTTNGNWTNAATWGGMVPTANDDVFVAHSVTLDTDAQVLSFSVRTTNRLTILAGKTLTATSFNLNGTITGNGNVVGNDFVIGPSTLSGVRLLDGSSLTINGNVQNLANRYLEASTVTLSGSLTRTIDGTVQTDESKVLRTDTNLVLSSSSTVGIRLGGVVTFGSYIVTANNALYLVGSGMASGSINAASSGVLLFIQPTASTFYITGVVSITAADGDPVSVTVANALSVSAGATLSINNLLLGCSLQGAGSVVVTHLALTTAGAISMSAASSVITSSGDIINNNNRQFDVTNLILADVLSSRTFSGLIQSRSGVITLADDQNINVGQTPLNFGGSINLQGYTMTVYGNVTLSGQQIQNGGSLVADQLIIISPGSSTYIVGGSSAALTSDNQMVMVSAGKRLSVLTGSSVSINSLLVVGSVIGTGSISVHDLVIEANGVVAMNGGSSLLTLRGNFENKNTGSGSCQADQIVLGSSDDSAHTFSGAVQTLKTGTLRLASNQEISQGSLNISLGGVIELGNHELIVSGSQVFLTGNGVNGNTGSITVLNGDMIVFPAGTSYLVNGNVQLHTSESNSVQVGISRRIAPQTNAYLQISPTLLLDGSGLDGTGTAAVQNIVIGNTVKLGEVRMDTGTGYLDIFGNVDNTVGGRFFAARIRFLGAFTRVVKGLVQTSVTSALVIGCSTTFGSGSSANLGGRLLLSGQTLNILDDLSISAAAVVGPGFIRFTDGCSCTAPPAVTIVPGSTMTVSGRPIIQNAILNVNRSVNLADNSTILEVAGPRTSLNVYARIQGSGNLRVYTGQIFGPTGRISLTQASFIEYVTPIVNNGTYPIVGTQRQQLDETELGACADEACVKSTLKDLQRQVSGLTAALSSSFTSGSCDSGACPGWNSDYSSMSCNA